MWRRAFSGSSRVSMPSTRSLPCDWRTSVAAIFKNVVLPAPLRPNKARNSPRLTLSVTPASATKWPNVLRMSSDSSANVSGIGSRNEWGRAFPSSQRRGGAEREPDRAKPQLKLGGEVFAGLTTPSAASLRAEQLLLRLRPIGLALRALLCEEGNMRLFHHFVPIPSFSSTFAR